jgi:hypothetical protein
MFLKRINRSMKYFRGTRKKRNNLNNKISFAPMQIRKTIKTYKNPNNNIADLNIPLVSNINSNINSNIVKSSNIKNIGNYRTKFSLKGSNHSSSSIIPVKIGKRSSLRINKISDRLTSKALNKLPLNNSKSKFEYLSSTT